MSCLTVDDLGRLFVELWLAPPVIITSPPSIQLQGRRYYDQLRCAISIGGDIDVSAWTN